MKLTNNSGLSLRSTDWKSTLNLSVKEISMTTSFEMNKTSENLRLVEVYLFAEYAYTFRLFIDKRLPCCK